MGVTGAGKSTFISKCCDEAAGGVGHGLKSITSQMQVFTFLHNGKSIHLIDTPGFDDTYKTDSEVLKDLAYYLGKSYGAGIRLTGIIYLHPITHTRMTGTAFKNLRTFRKLLGKQSMSSTVLVTTMWEGVDDKVGAHREQELKHEAEFWGDMIKEGSRVIRHANIRSSAINIVSTLLARNETTVLGLQTEMIVKGRSLEDTAAGREVDKEMRHQRKAFERRLDDTKKELEEAIKDRDETHVDAMLKEQEKWQSKLNDIQKGRDDMKIGLEKLIAEKDKQHMAEITAMKEKVKGAEEATEKQIQEYNKFKDFMEAQNKLQKEKLEQMQGETDEAHATAFLIALAAKEQDDEAKQKEIEYRHKEEMMRLKMENTRIANQHSSPPPPYPGYSTQSYQRPPSYNSYPSSAQYGNHSSEGHLGSAAAGAGIAGASLGAMALMTGCMVM